MDVLSDVLREFRVDGSVFCRVRGAGSWAVAYPASPAAAFHVVTEGACVLEVEGERHALARGEFVVLPHGHAHVLRDAAPGSVACATRIEDVAAEAARVRTGAPVRLGRLTGVSAGAPEPADVAGYLCGAFRFADGPAHPLLQLLPAVLRVRAGAGAGPGLCEADGPLGPWLDLYLSATTCEAASGRPGANFVLARLSDVLFVHAVRAHLAAEGGGTGWLAALVDPAVGRALALLHRDPARAWTVAALAREVAMSRSRFAARFTALVGRPPLDYLADWRMQRARGLLRSGRASVGEVAGQLGYRSEAAFSHAFRRRLGVPPGAYRRAQTAAAGAA